MKKYRILILWIGFITIIILGASVINEILFLVLKEKINNLAFNLISFTLIFLFITFLFKIKPFKELSENLDKLENKLKKKNL